MSVMPDSTAITPVLKPRYASAPMLAFREGIITKGKPTVKQVPGCPDTQVQPDARWLSRGKGWPASRREADAGREKNL
jgi:hypothetical protein